MKKLFVSALSLLCLTTASASVSKSLSIEGNFTDTFSVTAESYYDRLKRAYAATTTPYGAEGEADRVVRTGRCFLRGAPGTPLAAALVIRKMQEDAGPIADPADTRIATIWETSGSPDQYDGMTYAQIESAMDLEFLRGQVGTKEQAWVLKLADGASSQIRQDAELVYERISDSKNVVFAYCYYFYVSPER